MRNRAHPEGSIAEGYILNEAIGFMTEYMSNFKGVMSRVWDKNEVEWMESAIPEGASTKLKLSHSERQSIHNYVLNNTECMVPWLEYYKQESQCMEYERFTFAETWSQDPRASGIPVKYPVDLKLLPSFDVWICEAVRDPSIVQFVSGGASSDVLSLSHPPSWDVGTYKSLKAYGNHYRFILMKGWTGRHMILE
ncbi:unnamed protein product [Calypogeia fissa]